ncbi:MAG: isocitrate/isopropylmalate dehydrogenase family protein [Alphaproteobacteria bacterium]|nr:isocitrate/isopropylmalate dehydrogenase family protein [Alphaproteobacteria bacterium]
MRLLVLPGDGIGPEISAATVEILKAADQTFKLGLQFDYADIGLKTLRSHGTTLRPEVKVACTAADAVILGPVSHNIYPPRAEGGINPSGELRVFFDLYANIRPSRARPGLARTPHPMDLIIVRENTEGFYADRNMHMGIGEFMPDENMALAVRKITAHASNRIARAAFELARGRSRHVTVVHKANVLRISDGLFLRETRKVAREFPDVKCDEVIIDAMAALLIRDPSKFDVVVTTNMYGDILSDEAAELSGSLGLGGSINRSDTRALAQAQHGSAPDIEGQDKANPTSLILSAAMLLEWLGQKRGKPGLGQAASTITAAVDKVLLDPATRTVDIGGHLGTKAFTAAVLAEFAKQASARRVA